MSEPIIIRQRTSPATVVLLALGLIWFLNRRRTRQIIVAGFVPERTNPNVSNVVPSAADNAAAWAANAKGSPAIASPYGGGFTAGPVTQYLNGPGIVSGKWNTRFNPWSAPNAGQGPWRGSNAPGGTLQIPGPYPPASGGRAYAQSPTSAPSPWLPQDLSLAAPLATNTWFYNLSVVDPYVALAAGSGGYIDVARVNPMAAVLSAARVR